MIVTGTDKVSVQPGQSIKSTLGRRDVYTNSAE